MTPTALVQRWHFRCDRMQTAYYEAARRSSTRHLLLGIPAILLSTIVGTSIFASLAKLPFDPTTILWVQIGTGILSVSAAALAALQTFLQYSEEGEKHRVAASKFANLKHRIELVIAFPRDDSNTLQGDLIAIEDAWNKIRQESPNLPGRLWRRIEETIEPEEFSESGIAKN